VRPVYIAAPYTADTAEELAWNVARAALLGRVALSEGLCPIVVHPSIAAGVYGDDADPAERQAGINCSLQLLDLVKGAGGWLWVLAGESSGVRAEVARWGDPSAATVGSWEEWRHRVPLQWVPAWERLQTWKVTQ